MKALAARARDPFQASVAVLGALVIAGLVAVGAAWKGAAASLTVAIQLPYVVSGVMGGLALAGMCAALLAVQAGRYAEARRRADFDRVVRAAADLLTAVREGNA